MTCILDEDSARRITELVEDAATKKVEHEQRPLQGNGGGSIPAGCERHDALFLDGYLHGVCSAVAILRGECDGATLAREATIAAGGGR